MVPTGPFLCFAIIIVIKSFTYTHRNFTHWHDLQSSFIIKIEDKIKQIEPKYRIQIIISDKVKFVRSLTKDSLAKYILSMADTNPGYFPYLFLPQLVNKYPGRNFLWDNYAIENEKIGNIRNGYFINLYDHIFKKKEIYNEMPIFKIIF